MLPFEVAGVTQLVECLLPKQNVEGSIPFTRFMKNNMSNKELAVQFFLKEIEAVCKKHKFSLSHEDTQGGFIVEEYDKQLSEWLQQASVGKTVELKGNNA